jgi:hypothetical protein
LKPFIQISILPDLDPKEATWNDQSSNSCSYFEIDQGAQEWDKVTIAQTRARISEMPQRCEELIKTGGHPIKSGLRSSFELPTDLRLFHELLQLLVLPSCFVFRPNLNLRQLKILASVLIERR